MYLAIQLDESMKPAKLMHKILSIARRQYRIPLLAVRLYTNT